MSWYREDCWQRYSVWGRAVSDRRKETVRPIRAHSWKKDPHALKNTACLIHFVANRACFYRQFEIVCQAVKETVHLLIVILKVDILLFNALSKRFLIYFVVIWFAKNRFICRFTFHCLNQLHCQVWHVFDEELALFFFTKNWFIFLSKLSIKRQPENQTETVNLLFRCQVW